MICRECTLHQLEEDGNLDIFSFIEDTPVREYSDLPSWVPGFSVPSCDSTKHPLLEYQNPTTKFWLAPSSTPSPNIDIRHSPDELITLCVFGKIVDTILHLDSGESASIELHRRLGEWLEMIGPNSPSKDNKYCNGDTRRAARSAVLHHPALVLPSECTVRDPARSCAFCPPSGQVQQVHDVQAHMLRTGESMEEVLRLVGLDEKRFERWQETSGYFVEDIDPLGYMRRFFITQDMYFGFGERSFQIWDNVVVLLGGKVPYALRPIEVEKKVYRFVSDVYVARNHAWQSCRGGGCGTLYDEFEVAHHAFRT
jgi:hypothetical protein